MLHAAVEVVAERGIELTRYSDIAQRADVSISTLQYLFGSLDTLIVEIVTFRAREYLATAERSSQALADPITRLGWVINHFVTADVSEEDARADWLVWVEYWRAAARDPSLSAESHRTYEGWLAILREALAAGVDAGAFTPRLAVDAIARGILAMSDGLGIQIILEHGGVSRRDASRLCRSWAAIVLDCPGLL